MKEILPIDIDIKVVTEEDYHAAKNKFIAEYKEYEPGSGGGFFSKRTYGRDVNKPDIGAAKWASYYPRGFYTWSGSHGEGLSPYGQKQVIDKVNEIIAFLNKKK